MIRLYEPHSKNNNIQNSYKIYTIQLVYGSHPLMPIKYILLIIGRDHKRRNFVRVVANRISEVEKL